MNFIQVGRFALRIFLTLIICFELAGAFVAPAKDLLIDIAHQRSVHR